MEDVELQGLSFEIEANVGKAAEGISELGKSLTELKKVLKNESFRSSLSGLVQGLKGVGEVLKAIPTNLNFQGLSGLTNFVKTAGSVSKDGIENLKSIAGVVKKFSGTNVQIKGFGAITNFLKFASACAPETITKVDDLIAKLKELEGLNVNFNFKKPTSKGKGTSGDDKPPKAPDVGDYEKISGSFAKFRTRIASVKKDLSEFANQHPKVVKAMGKIKKALKSVGKFMAKAFVLKPIKALGKVCTSVGKTIGRVLTTPFRKASSAAKHFFSAIKRVTVFRLLRRAMQRATQAIKDGINSLYEFSNLNNGTFKKSMDTLSTSALYLKNSLGASLSSVINALAPIIEKVVDKFVGFINVINEMIAKITGADHYTVAKKVTQQYDSGLSEANKEADKLQETLLGFDKINKLDSNNSSSSDSTTDYSSMFEEKKIENASKGLEATFSNLAKTISDKLEGIDWSDAKEKASSWGKKLGEIANTIVTDNNWKTIGSTISNAITTGTTAIKSFFDELDGKSIGTTINDFFTGFDSKDVTNGFADAFNSIIDTVYDLITTVEWSTIGEEAGEATAEGVKKIKWKKLAETFASAVLGAFNLVSGFLTTSKVGDAIATIFNTITDTLEIILDGLKFDELGRQLANELNDGIKGTKWEKVGKNISKAISGALTFVTEFIKTTDFTAFGRSVADMLVGLDWLELIKNSVEAVGAVFAGVGEFLGGILFGFFKNRDDKEFETFDEYIEKYGKTKGLRKFIADYNGTDEIPEGKATPEEIMNAVLGPNLYDDVLVPAGNAIKSFFENLGVSFGIIWDGVTSFWNNAKTDLKAWWNGGEDHNGTTKTGVKNSLALSFGIIWDGIKTAWSNAKTDLLAWWNGGTYSNGNTANGVKNSLSLAFNVAWDGLKTGWSTVKTTLTNWWEGEDGKSGVKGELELKWLAAFGGISTSIDNAKSKVKNWWSGSDGKSGVKAKIIGSWKAAFGGISTSIGNAKSKVKNWWSGSDGKSGVKAKITGSWKAAFGGIDSTIAGAAAYISAWWDSVKQSKSAKCVLNIGIKISTAFEKAFASVIDWFTSAINEVIMKINTLLPKDKQIQVISNPSWVNDTLYGTRCATGGIITHPYYNNGLALGEQGAEAILPLQTNTEWMDSVADKIVYKMNKSEKPQSVQIPIYIGGNKVSDVVIDDINKRTSATGVCPIRV